MLKIKDAYPLYSGLFVTSDRYENDEFNEHGVIIAQHGEIKPYQKVVKTGPLVRNVKVGDMVKINLGKYAKWMYDKNSLKNDLPEARTNTIVDYIIPTVFINGEKYYHIDENDAMMVITDWEEVDEEPKILQLESKIILPE